MNEQQYQHVIGAIHAIRYDLNRLERMVHSLMPAKERVCGNQHTLTPAEYDTLVMAAEGLTNMQIAARRNVARTTVTTQLSSVYEKLNVTSRVEAALWLQRNGGIDDG